MTNLEKGKEYFIQFRNSKKLNFHISGYPIQYFLSFSFFNNDILFTKFNIDKHTFTMQTLGYYSDADWPWCATIDDINRLLFALLKAIQDKGYKFICNFEWLNETSFWDD